MLPNSEDGLSLNIVPIPRGFFELPMRGTIGMISGGRFGKISVERFHEISEGLIENVTRIQELLSYRPAKFIPFESDVLGEEIGMKRNLAILPSLFDIGISNAIEPIQSHVTMLYKTSKPKPKFTKSMKLPKHKFNKNVSKKFSYKKSHR